MEQIRLGLEKHLDVLIYAKTIFVASQMEQIRLGLEKRLDVSIYAKSEFDNAQMEQILLGLMARLDVSIYTIPVISWQLMCGLREELLRRRDR